MILQKEIPKLRFKEFEENWTDKVFGSFITPRVEYPNVSHNLQLCSLTIEKGVTPKTARYERSHLVKSDDDAYKIVYPGDFVSNPMNLRFGAIAKHHGKEKVLVSKYYDVFHVDKNVVSDFIEMYFSTNRTLGFYNSLATGTLDEKKRVHFSDFVTFKRLFPAYKEQQKIADFLSGIDKKIVLLKEKHSLLAQYKKGVMQKLFLQQIRFKDEAGKNFPDWEVKKGNEIFRAMSNKKHNSDLPILAITQDQGAIPRELINYQVQVTENSVASYKVVEKGDFIISLRSFQGGIEYSNYKGICSPAYIILQPSIAICDDFYRYYLKTNNFIQEMKKRLEGIRDGKILSYKYFSEISLPFPCIEEQQRITEFLGALDKKLNLVSEQIEHTQTFKKGLLQQMFV